MKTIFYSHFAGNPYYNMAFDEWMFSNAIKNKASIYLRLYTWSQGSITFGLNQKKETALNFEKLNGTPIIRRITGGRALYHDLSELTYSIAINTDNLENNIFKGTHFNIFRAIADILVKFLGELGVCSDYIKQSSEQDLNKDIFHKTACFASNAKYEIITDSQKIVASAQRCFENTIFQHGSIKINGLKTHPALTIKDLKCKNDKKIHSITKKQFNNFVICFEKVFSDLLEASFQDIILSKVEENQIEKRIKYIKKKSTEKRDLF
ncbi:MAG: biotin/lipoate A/B protein ligase family protein [Candidatus Zixiibacteriota bacterium]